jgi:hypothetical protein
MWRQQQRQASRFQRPGAGIRQVLLANSKGMLSNGRVLAAAQTASCQRQRITMIVNSFDEEVL